MPLDFGSGLSLSLVLGLLVAVSFPLGALFSLKAWRKIQGRLRADIASFASGIFFGAIAFSLVHESTKLGNPLTMIAGFALGAVILSGANHQFLRMEEKAAKKKMKEKSPSEGSSSSAPAADSDDSYGNPMTIVVGSLLDSVPESIFIGVLVALELPGLIGNSTTLFLGNIATAMEAARRMIERGDAGKKILLRWTIVFVIVGLATPMGFVIATPDSKLQLSIILGAAAGALLALITEELIPQAYSQSQIHTGLSATFGFLLAFALINFVP